MPTSSSSSSTRAVADPGGGGLDPQVVATGAAGVEVRRLEGRADDRERVGDVGVALAVDRRRAGAGADEAEQHPQRRRLARAVGAEEAGDAAGLDVEVEVVDRREGPEALRQTPHLDPPGVLPAVGVHETSPSPGPAGSILTGLTQPQRRTCGTHVVHGPRGPPTERRERPDRHGIRPSAAPIVGRDERRRRPTAHRRPDARDRVAPARARRRADRGHRALRGGRVLARRDRPADRAAGHRRGGRPGAGRAPVGDPALDPALGRPGRHHDHDPRRRLRSRSPRSAVCSWPP